MNIWNIINLIFFYITLLGVTIFIIKTNWSDLSPLDALKNCGFIGGLLFFSEFFRKESKDSSVHTGARE